MNDYESIVAVAWMHELIECGATEEEAAIHVIKRLITLHHNEQTEVAWMCGKSVLVVDEAVAVAAKAKRLLKVMTNC